jgi:hypothetical protein
MPGTIVTIVAIIPIAIRPRRVPSGIVPWIVPVPGVIPGIIASIIPG